MTKKEKETGRKTWKHWEIDGIKLFGRDRMEVLRVIAGWLGEKGEKKVRLVATVNPEFVMAAEKDGEFLAILQEETDLNVVDGIGLVWARALDEKFQETNSKKQTITNDQLRKFKTVVRRLVIGFWVGVEILQGKHREKLVPGAELMDGMMGLGYTVGFLGGWANAAEGTEEYFKSKYGGLKSVVIGSEYDGKTDKIMEVLEKNKVRVVLVAYGMCKQEKWMVKHREMLARVGVRVAMGVGRSFDYYGGSLPRASGWMRDRGLEWLYSLVTDKSRRKRKLELIKFIIKIIKN